MVPGTFRLLILLDMGNIWTSKDSKDDPRLFFQRAAEHFETYQKGTERDLSKEFTTRTLRFAGIPVRGKAQAYIVTKISKWPAGHTEELADMARGFRGHFAALMKGAEALAKKGWVTFDGSKVTVTPKASGVLKTALLDPDDLVDLMEIHGMYVSELRKKASTPLADHEFGNYLQILSGHTYAVERGDTRKLKAFLLERWGDKGFREAVAQHGDPKMQQTAAALFKALGESDRLTRVATQKLAGIDLSVDKRKGMLGLQNVTAMQVNSSNKRAILGQAVSILRGQKTLWVRDPHFVLATVWGSVTTFGAEMAKLLAMNPNDIVVKAVRGRSGDYGLQYVRAVYEVLQYEGPDIGYEQTGEFFSLGDAKAMGVSQDRYGSVWQIYRTLGKDVKRVAEGGDERRYDENYGIAKARGQGLILASTNQQSEESRDMTTIKTRLLRLARRDPELRPVIAQVFRRRLASAPFPVRGKGQKLIMDYVGKRIDAGKGVGTSYKLTDVSRGSMAGGVSFTMLVKAAKALGKSGWIDWDGSNVKVTQKALDHAGKGGKKAIRMTTQDTSDWLAKIQRAAVMAMGDASLFSWDDATNTKVQGWLKTLATKKFRMDQWGNTPVSWRLGRGVYNGKIMWDGGKLWLKMDDGSSFFDPKQAVSTIIMDAANKATGAGAKRTPARTPGRVVLRRHRNATERVAARWIRKVASRSQG
jgi:hypothetical protein